MAWSYSQNFDSLTDGNLGGQDSWSAFSNANPQVGASYKFAGAKGIRLYATSLGSVGTRTITGTGSGVFYFAFKAITIGTSDVYFKIDNGTQYGVMMKASRIDDNSFKFLQYTGSYVEVSGSLSKDQWYIGAIEYDVSTDQMRFNSKPAGGSWAGWSGWKSFQTAQTNLTRLVLGFDPGWEMYEDEYSDTEPSSDVPHSKFFIIH